MSRESINDEQPEFSRSPNRWLHVERPVAEEACADLQPVYQFAKDTKELLPAESQVIPPERWHVTLLNSEVQIKDERYYNTMRFIQDKNLLSHPMLQVWVRPRQLYVAGRRDKLHVALEVGNETATLQEERRVLHRSLHGGAPSDEEMSKYRPHITLLCVEDCSGSDYDKLIETVNTSDCLPDTHIRLGQPRPMLTQQ